MQARTVSVWKEQQINCQLVLLIFVPLCNSCCKTKLAHASASRAAGGDPTPFVSFVSFVWSARCAPCTPRTPNARNAARAQGASGTPRAPSAPGAPRTP